MCTVVHSCCKNASITGIKYNSCTTGKYLMHRTRVQCSCVTRLWGAVAPRVRLIKRWIITFVGFNYPSNFDVTDQNLNNRGRAAQQLAPPGSPNYVNH